MANRTPQFHVLHSKSLDFTPFDVRWVPQAARFAVVGQTPGGAGVVQIMELDDKGGVRLGAEASTRSALRCLTFGASWSPSREFATGNFDGYLEIRELDQLDKVTYSVKAHESLINCIDGAGGVDCQSGPPEIVTGSRDGQVKIWDTRQKSSPVARFGSKAGEQAKDVWAVALGNAFNDQDRIVCAGYEDGQLKMFDLRAMEMLWTTNLKAGVCSIEFDRKDTKMNKLVATTTDSSYHTFDLRTFNPESGFACLRHNFGGENVTVWGVRHLPQNRDVFITSCADGTMQLYKYNYPESRTKKDKNGDLVGVTGTLTRLRSANVASQPVGGFDWSKDKMGLCVFASFDQSVRVGVATRLNLV